MNRSRTSFDRPGAARRRAARPVVEGLEGRLLLSEAAGKSGPIRYGTWEEVVKATRQPTNSPDVPFLNSPAPTLWVRLLVDDDPGDTKVSASPKVRVAGFASPPFSTVWLGRGPRGAFTTATVADQNGYYEFDVVARPGDNLVRVFAGANFQFSEPIEFRFTSGDAVLAWDAIALRAVANQDLEAPEAARALAILHVAQHDAIASIRAPGSAFHDVVPAPRGASEAAAAHAAGQAVLAALFPADASDFDTLLDSAKAGLPKTRAVRDGLAVGRKAAAATLAWRARDGSDAGLSRWGNVEPFAISSAASFRPGPPPAEGSAAFDEALEQVRVQGSADSLARTTRQTLTARFWDPGAPLPADPGVWNQVAERLAVRAGSNLWANARTFAMLDVAMADAEIVAYDAKSAFNLGRPRSAIGQDDPAWTPLLATPATPSYVSDQAAYATAASTILASEFGASTDVVVTSPALGSTRVYDTSAEAASDAGLSGVYGGIQFGFDVSAGSVVGESVARDVLADFPGKGKASANGRRARAVDPSL